ncbi:hypothetical protein [Pseudooceanicola sp. 200-1SW]|uniref:hypothetical protein n=1 Tax=Pseudooceanicola sp. 200-1SW TaxID=3425949 RepID=UPI003D7FF372
MIQTFDFPLAQPGGAPVQISFTRLDQLEDLPDQPGLYVLLGRDRAGALHPLVFGHADRLTRLPQGEEFALALREGLYTQAIAPLPDGADGPALACALGAAHDAPINTRRAALRAIEAARLSVTPAAPLAAE